jgi:hypothetical protein
MDNLIFPREPRSFPGRRGLKILLRAVHVLCAGVLTGGYVLGVSTQTTTPWLTATLVSGTVILLLDLLESGVFLLQLRGWIVLAKIGTLATLPWLGALPAAWLLGAMMLFSVLSSHAPSRARYFIPLGGKGLKGACTKG